jgi:hypothetical protein
MECDQRGKERQEPGGEEFRPKTIQPSWSRLGVFSYQPSYDPDQPEGQCFEDEGDQTDTGSERRGLPHRDETQPHDVEPGGRKDQDQGADR